MYRDDDEAARALAEQLRRENAELEDQRAELSNEKAELALSGEARRRVLVLGIAAVVITAVFVASLHAG